MADLNNTETKKDPLATVPADLRDEILARVGADSLRALSQYDLDAQGRYTSGYLVLDDQRLWRLSNGNGRWSGEALDLDDLHDVRVVEGLGMRVLRLNGQDGMLAEFRYTNRHAKAMAELQSILERRIAKQEQAERELAGGRSGPRGPEGGEKKTHCEKCGSAIPDWAETCPRCLQQRKVLMRLIEFVKPHWWRVAVGFCLALSGLVLELARPKLSQYLFDDAIEKTNVPLLGWLILAFGVIMVSDAVISAVRGRIMAGLGMRVAAEIRDRCYTHLHKLSLAYYSRKSTGSLITRVTSDSDRIWDFVAFNLVEVIIGLLTFVGVGVMLFLTNWRLAALVLLPIPVMITLTVIFHKKMHKQFHRIWHRWSAMTAVVADAIPGMRVIKAFSQEKREVERFNLRNYQVYEEENRLMQVFTFFGPAMALATQVGFLTIWGVGGYWAIRDGMAGRTDPGAMTIGKIVAFQGFMWMFLRPIHMVAHMSRMFNRAATSVQRILEVLDSEPEIYSKREARPLDDLGGRIEFRNVSFSYDGVRRVLKNLNFTIEPGQMVGLAGPSGSGKTTLVNLICRFYDPVEGEILLDGIDLRDYKVEDLRRHIGVVLQEPYLFRGTIAENIAYGNPGADILHVLQAAKAANVHDAVVGFPDGYDTMVGERGHTLSGGERQRISIARAILNNPRLLILDEATSSVDTQTEQQIQEAIHRLIANRSTIAIAHRLSTLRKADKLIVLEKGEIVEMGAHEELDAKPDGVYAKLLRTQVEQKSVIALQE